MATYEITKTTMRLDEVVMLYYGSLEQFSAVNEANPSLGLFLSKGDVVELPEKSAVVTEEVLW
ncbi:tail protein X [Marinomonas balearica]|uniref:Tail protein X n=1 Tax=Marinomonas balearica TaxID=491947 RepID=A0A4R6M7Q4_9GAMM|nr:tail protein X [Marinomonas balearica]TDO97458.1 tail protein X [Marinomonas balearica]